MRTTARPRRAVSPVVIALLTPLFRYSTTRDAWVLRGIGNFRGPVIVRRDPQRAEKPELDRTSA